MDVPYEELSSEDKAKRIAWHFDDLVSMANMIVPRLRRTKSLFVRRCGELSAVRGILPEDSWDAVLPMADCQKGVCNALEEVELQMGQMSKWTDGIADKFLGQPAAPEELTE